MRLDFIAPTRPRLEVHEQRRVPERHQQRNGDDRADEEARVRQWMPRPACPSRAEDRSPLLGHRLAHRRHRFAAEVDTIIMIRRLPDQRDAAERDELRGVLAEPARAGSPNWSGFAVFQRAAAVHQARDENRHQQHEHDAEHRHEHEHLHHDEEREQQQQPLRRALAEQRKAFDDPHPAVPGRNRSRRGSHGGYCTCVIRCACATRAGRSM